MLDEDGDGGIDSPVYDFIESCLRHKNDMVIYEAASAIVSLKCTTTKELAMAVSVLQLLSGSSKPTLKYAAVKTLNKVNRLFLAIDLSYQIICACLFDLDLNNSSSCCDCMQHGLGSIDYGSEP